jgi:predicted HicB family RNase H-like nuclease
MMEVEAKERRKVRLSMDLEPELHKRLKIEVAHRGESITEYVKRILAESLERGETETRKAS